MPESGDILYDLNKVFIPCRSVLEMEALTSLFLEHYNYDLIKELPKSQVSSSELIKIFQVLTCKPLEKIIEYFIDIVVSKLKPVVMYERDHHDRLRIGNIVANVRSRTCLFLALQRLKFKFLIIDNFMKKFKENDFKLDKEKYPSELGPHAFLSAFYDYFHEKNLMNLKLMLSTKRVSDRVSKLINTSEVITNEDIINAITFKKFLDDKNRLKFIMKEIKASLFVSKIMLMRMDVPQPFYVEENTEINVEDMMIDQDFIPTMIPAIAKNYSENNIAHIEELYNVFEFIMNRILDGINNAVKITSEGQIKLDRDELIYTSGHVFEDFF